MPVVSGYRTVKIDEGIAATGFDRYNTSCEFKKRAATMFSVSRFGELFQAFPKSVFQQEVNKVKADRKRSQCRSWDVLLLSVFGQLSQSRSLRACVDTFNAQQRHHYHLGTREMKRSTVSDALSR